MTVKVIKKFKDKYTLKMYEIGDIIEVDEKRYEEIKDFVNVKTTKKKTKKSKGESQE